MVMVYPSRIASNDIQTMGRISQNFTRMILDGSLSKVFKDFNSMQNYGRRAVVECLTRDRGVAGSSLTSITALCP